MCMADQCVHDYLHLRSSSSLLTHYPLTPFAATLTDGECDAAKVLDSIQLMLIFFSLKCYVHLYVIKIFKCCPNELRLTIIQQYIDEFTCNI
jgi:hypothetical protein